MDMENTFVNGIRNIFFQDKEMPKELNYLLTELSFDFLNNAESPEHWQLVYTYEPDIGVTGLLWTTTFQDFELLQITITIGKMPPGTILPITNEVGNDALKLFKNHKALLFDILGKAPRIKAALDLIGIKQFNLTGFSLVQNNNFEGDINYNRAAMTTLLWSDKIGLDVKIVVTNQMTYG